MMPYGAHVFAAIEDALSEVLQYHDGLDLFVRRAGIPDTYLRVSRERVEERARLSQRQYSRAPKRLVVQELLVELGKGTEADDRLVAGLITSLCKGRFPEASATALEGIKTLQRLQDVERREAEERRDAERQKRRTEEREREELQAAQAEAREGFKRSFLQLCQQSDAQARGYALEKFLNEFLAFEKLSPRGSFKLIGEQIDGSFDWSGRTHLVEAKWVDAPVGGTGFSGLMYKIEGKTADTRGLFISINGYSAKALEGLSMKGELRFICIDGAHLIRCLEHSGNFARMLEALWRHANETGEAYLPVGSEAFAKRYS